MQTLRGMIKKATAKLGVKDPNAISQAQPYRAGFSLSPNSALASLGFPNISFPGATGTESGPGIQALQKRTVVYGQRSIGNFFDLGGGWTYSAFDRPPEGGISNHNQV